MTDATFLFRQVAVQLEQESGGEFVIWGGAKTLDPMMWEGFVMSDTFRQDTALANAFVKACLQAYEDFYAGDPTELAEAYLAEERPEIAGLDPAETLVVGVPLGIAAGANVTLERAIEPNVNALFVAPVSALTPLFVYWFGLGLAPRIATVFVFCAPVIMLTCYRGARETPRTMAEVARVYGADGWQVFRSVVVPHSVPYIATAVRLGLGRAIKGTVLAELVISATGLGALLDDFSHVFDTASIIATLIFLLLLGVLIQVVAARIEVAVAPWRGSRAVRSARRLDPEGHAAGARPHPGQPADVDGRVRHPRPRRGDPAGRYGRRDDRQPGPGQGRRRGPIRPR